MRKSLSIIAILLAVIAAPAVLRADDIVYTVNQMVGPGSVTGFITTDGTIGTLSSTNILDWNLTLNDGHGDVSDLIPSNSAVGSRGTDLTASSSDLMFNFNGNDIGAFYFSSSAGQLCYDSATNCALTPGVDLFDVAGVIPCAYYGCNTGETGNQVIASGGTPVSTPEPGSLGSLGIGLAGVGLCWFRMRKHLAPVLLRAT
jgi:hypothetical protein